MRIFYLEDHTFFATDIVKNLKYLGHEVFYAPTYKAGEKIVEKHGPFDVSILDVLLKNGRTGIVFAEKHKPKLGRFMFLTGCRDEATLSTLGSKRYISMSKLYTKTMPKIVEFLNNEDFYHTIPLSEAC